MASGDTLFGSYYAHEPGGSPSWLFQVRDGDGDMDTSHGYGHEGTWSSRMAWLICSQRGRSMDILQPGYAYICCVG